MLRILAGLALLAVFGPSEAAPADASDFTVRFLEAKHAYDVAALEALTAENYVEVTEEGDLRSRAHMLAYHAKGRSGVYRNLKLGTVETRTMGDVAVQTVLLNYKVIAVHKDLLSAARATLVAHRRDGQWKLVSAHFTSARVR